MMYEEKMTRLWLGKFDIDNLNDVGLWVVNPDWSRWGKPSAAGIYEEWYFGPSAYDRSAPNAVMILWLPMASVHQYPFDPDECEPWVCCGTIVSGSDPLYIGYVYRKGDEPLGWKCRVISDRRGKRASSSSNTVKFMLEEFVKEGQTVVEPYAHRSAVLPTWCRRHAISYVGYTESRKVHGDIAKKLAQVELPGIQLALPSTYG